MTGSSAESGFLTRRYGVLLGAILVLGLLLRLAVYFDLRATDLDFYSPPLDSRVFLQWATDIASGDVLGDRPFFLNPLYPYCLAPIVKLAGEHVLLAIRFVQGLLGLLTVLLVAGATRRTLGPRASLLAALVTCSWPLLLFYEQAVMIVTLAVFLNALTLFLLARLADRQTIGAALLAGVPLGLSVLARPNVALFALMLPLWLATLAPRGARLRFVALRTAALFAGILAVILPVTLRNWIVGRDVVLVTSSMGLNLWQSNNPEARRTGRMTSLELRSHPIFIEADSITLSEQAEGRPLKPSEVSRHWSRRTAEAVGRSPGPSTVFLVRKLLYFVSGDEPPSSHHFAAQREVSPSLRWDPLSFAILSPLALIGLFAVLVAARAGLPLLMIYAAYAVGLTLFFPLAHYRAPVLPAAIPLAVLGVLHLARAVSGGRGCRIRAALALILAVCVTNLSLAAGALGIDSLAPYPDERVVYWYNRGLSLLGRGEDLAAEQAFSRARDEAPSSWLPDQGLALLARARRELATEEAHLRRVLALRGENPETVYMLGRNLFERGRRREGLRMVEWAALEDPRAPPISECLGDLYMSLGRPGDALPMLEAAEVHGRRSVRNTALQSYCLRMLGRHEEARARVVRGISTLPRAGPLHFEMAFLLIDEGAPAEEIRERVLEGRAEGLDVPEELKRFLE